MRGPDALTGERRSGRAELSDAETGTAGTGSPGTATPGTATPGTGMPRAAAAGGAGRHTSTRSRARRAPGRPRRLSLSNWPVAARLVAVAAVASVTGLVFGGLRVADAINTADSYGRTAQLAILGEQVTTLAQAMENERDVYAGVAAYEVLSSGAAADRAAPSVTGKIATALDAEQADLGAAEKTTGAQAQRTRALAVAIGPAFPASVQGKAATVVQTIDSIPGLRSQVAGQPAAQVIPQYTSAIGALLDLDNEITSGSGDPVLADDVRALNAISQEKEATSRLRAILYSTLLETTVYDAGSGRAPANNLASGQPLSDAGGITQLATALGLQSADQADFLDAATAAQSSEFTAVVGGQQDVVVSNIDGNVATYQNPQDLFESVPGLPAGTFDRTTLASTWYTAATGEIAQLRTIETQVAAQTVARAQALQQQAAGSAILAAALTAAAELLVLLATALVGRTLVNPLRRLQADALEIAMSRLPARVAAAASGADSPEASAMVEPVGVRSTDEIGRVARAFDRVHAEAVRLAGTEAQLRGSLNTMFISMSRRSVPLIDRLARMIDAMEQDEDDPGRLANLFAMDHMVTRMRRNSENLLVLAGEEPIRKWTESVPLTDVARAAAAEIEQYNRVALAVQPGIVISGQAAADVVHLLAELIENATLFSPQSTQVRVTVMELSSGGVLIEIRDDGVGISDARLADMNWRLDHPPMVDVSVSRHMGLYAVARLAARHGIKVRLRPATPQGLSALVWLPGNLARQGPAPAPDSNSRATGADRGTGAWPTASGRHGAGRLRNGLLATSGDQPALGRRGTPAGRPGTVWFTAKRPSGALEPPEEVAAGWRPAAPGLPVASEPPGRTTSGLPRRLPRTSARPGEDTPGRGMAAAATATMAPVRAAPFGPPADDPAGEGAPHAPHHEQAPPRRRSPEAARSRLSGFQLGNRDAAEADRGAGWAQHAGEENGR